METGEDPVAEARENSLTPTEQKMLRLESRPFKYAGAKQEAIRALLNLSSAAYYQRLNRLIDSEAAEAFDPQLVRRLRASRPAPLRSPAARPLGRPQANDTDHEES
ncbi:MAG: DUF3263 domain-containing protein [Arthrobacter sp.]|nr:DUF3263 domain-containing protein [Arthrobacter sp.]